MPASPGFKKGVNSGSFILVFVCFLITSTISFYLHIPGKEPVFNNFGLAYSDIVSGVFNPIFKDIVTPYGDIDSKALSERWYDSDTASKLLRSNICPVPYKDYRFEYPPIVALLWYISTCIAIKVALPTSYTSIQYYSLVDSVANVHYYVQSAFIITFLVVLTIYMYRIALTLGISWKRVVMFLFLPSTVLYLVYNWDIIAAAFAIVSLYYLMHKKYLASGIALGLSISTKVIPAVFAFIIVYDMIQKVLRDKSFGNNLKLLWPRARHRLASLHRGCLCILYRVSKLYGATCSLVLRKLCL
uniref:DUF2029 domain-containing protein n=1 Tax=Ignisphaera aggregans TaxID=334771 RepID=A0A7C2ZQR7_9CREN